MKNNLSFRSLTGQRYGSFL